MGAFFYFGDHDTTHSIGGYSPEFFHRHQCEVCPLNKRPGRQHPHMEPTGAEQPLIYALGEGPGKAEDAQGVQFVGPSGDYLRQLVQGIDPAWFDCIRWNNCVRTRVSDTKEDIEPTEVMIESCRPSVAADIEQSAPEAVFGFGNVPLQWFTGERGITSWNGRRMPVKVGNHVCWFFPFMHPAYILRLRDMSDKENLAEDMAFVFRLDLERALAAVADGLPTPVIHSREQALEGIERLRSVDAVLAALQDLSHEHLVGLDIETNSKRPYNAEACILTVALSAKHRTVTFPLYHRDAHWTPAEREEVESAFADFLAAPNCRKISYYLPFEMEWLTYFYGRKVAFSEWGDGHAMAFLLHGRGGKLSLEVQCLQHFGINIKAINNTDRANLDRTPLDTVLVYNGVDAKYHREVYLAQLPMIKNESLLDVYQHHVKRIRAAVLSQIPGVPVNAETVERFYQDYTQRKDAIEAEIAADPTAAEFASEQGHAYRPSANPDIMAMFGTAHAREEEIVTIDHPLAKKTLAWKSVSKMLSTYIQPLRADDKRSQLFLDGLLHPQLRLDKTRTWRSSCEMPNYQNIPKHDEDDKELRAQIEAPAGHKIVALDYGQIQARNVAMESKDTPLVRSFWDREDIHSYWAERIMRLYPRWVSEGVKAAVHDKVLWKKYRNKAKNGFVFASFFGASGRTCANHLGIPEDIGYQLSEEFWARFGGVKQWHQHQHEFYDSHGYTTGLSGFRRYAPVAHTELVNTAIQSDEAIIVFDAGIRLVETEEPRFTPRMYVHDDLNFIWPDAEIERNAEFVIKTMLDCPFEWAHIVPLSVEMSVGQNWKVMQDLEGGVFESDRFTGSLSQVKWENYI